MEAKDIVAAVESLDLRDQTRIRLIECHGGSCYCDPRLDCQEKTPRQYCEMFVELKTWANSVEDRDYKIDDMDGIGELEELGLVVE